MCVAKRLYSSKKLRADCSKGKLAIIRCRILLSSFLLSKNIKIKKYLPNCTLPVALCGYEIACLYWGRNVGWVCLRIGCWGSYLGLRDVVTGEWRRLHNKQLYYLLKLKLSLNKTLRLRRSDGMLVLYPYFDMAAQLGRQTCQFSAPRALHFLHDHPS